MSGPKVSNKLLCARKMPELKHRTDDSDFDITKSEVCTWLAQQPDILNYVFDKVRGNRYREPLIVYDSERGTWKGIDYED